MSCHPKICRYWAKKSEGCKRGTECQYSHGPLKKFETSDNRPNKDIYHFQDNNDNTSDSISHEAKNALNPNKNGHSIIQPTTTISDLNENHKIDINSATKMSSINLENKSNSEIICRIDLPTEETKKEHVTLVTDNSITKKTACAIKQDK